MLSLLALLSLPLSGGERWHPLRYGDKPANEITYGEKLEIQVKGSASPLFYDFGQTADLEFVKVEGELGGLPALPDGKTEGEGGADDLPLRFGIVVEGNERLGWLQRLFAPGWLKQLTEIVSDRNFEGVRFLTIAQRTEPGSTRVHPMSRYLTEEVVKRMDKPGPFSFEKTYTEPPRMMGLWIQADGDDTRSSFNVALKSVTLRTRERPGR